MIALESVSKRYGSKTIIHDLSFTVEKGEVVGFLGPNGAGKTTTLRMIAGYIAATSGRVSVAGYDMASQNVDAARPIHAAVTAARVNDITAAQAMPIEAGASYVFDLGYYDYAWWAALDAARCRIVTRF